MEQAPGKLDDALAFIMYRTARLLRYSLLQNFKRFGFEITPEQWFVLYRLWEKDGRPQSELGDKELDDRPNITRIIDSLEKNGLVQRTADPDDRRKFKVVLTEKGEGFLKEMRTEIPKERERIFHGVSVKDRQLLKSILQTVQSNIVGNMD